MAHIASNILLLVMVYIGGYDGVVTADGAWGGGEGVSCSEHGYISEARLRGRTATGLDDVFAFPDHCDNRAGVHVYC